MRWPPTIAAALAAGLIAAPGLTSGAQAQTDPYPSKPVRIIVDSAPGSATDISARLMADRLTQVWGQQAIIINQPGAGGSIAILLTSDEEGDAVDGTAALVSILRARGVTIDACIVGEPTSTERFGDTIKNGRRGSLNGRLRVRGQQCHIAYPERGRNPIHDAAPAISALVVTEWDRGNEYFQPTSFQISNIQAGTGATNIIPGTLDVAFNFRFSPESTAQVLRARVREVLDRHNLQYDLEWTLIGEPFLTRRGPLVDALIASVESVAGVRPALSTSGGTSDGRFLATLAREVVEFGPLNDSIHKIDEHVRIGDLEPLSVIYERTVTSIFEAFARS